MRISVTALFAAAVVHLAGTLLVGDGYNTFALVFELVLVTTAILAASGRWWALGISGLFSGFLGSYTLISQAELLTGGDVGEAAVMLAFVAVTLTAGLSALWGSATILSSRRRAQVRPG